MVEGTVYQRKDGRWVGCIDVGENGVRKRKYVYAKKEKDAKIALNKLAYELQNNIYRDAGNATVGSYLEEWYKVNVNTWEQTTAGLYRFYLDKHIIPKLGEIKLNKLIPMHITSFINAKLEENSQNTVNKYLSLLSSAFDSAVKNSLILTNPISQIKRPKKIKYAPSVYTPEQFEKLLSYIKGTPDEIPILLAGLCGLRRGEVFGLRWEDVHFENNKISVNETSVRFRKDFTKSPKNETSKRTIAAPKLLFEILKSYKADLRTVDLNFKSARVCTMWKPDSYSKRFNKLLVKFEMPHIRFHDLRHFNAVIMMQYGIPDKVAAKRLEHSNTQTLREVYQHVLTGMDEEAANKIEEAFK